MVIVLLCVPWIVGCGTHDDHKATIQRTISELREKADFWEAMDSDEARSYLAPAYRRAVPLLEEDGASALPMLLSATFFQGYYDASTKKTGPCYGFSWLELNDEVRGFYLRSEGKPDLEVCPAFSKEPAVPGTACMVTGGAVVANEKEKENMIETTIIVDAEFLAQKKVLVGLILANGQKTAPVPAYFRPGPPG